MAIDSLAHGPGRLEPNPNPNLSPGPSPVTNQFASHYPSQVPAIHLVPATHLVPSPHSAPAQRPLTNSLPTFIQASVTASPHTSVIASAPASSPASPPAAPLAQRPVHQATAADFFQSAKPLTRITDRTYFNDRPPLDWVNDVIGAARSRPYSS